MTGEYRDDVFYIELPERIDSKNALAVETEIDSLLEEYKPETIVFDADRLEYISSAGLRVFLKLIKRRVRVTVINISDYVYNIFDLAGYDNLISLKKKESQDE